jgi:hypothetical protein
MSNARTGQNVVDDPYKVLVVIINHILSRTSQWPFRATTKIQHQSKEWVVGPDKNESVQSTFQ